MTARRSLRGDLHARMVALDALPNGTIITDQYGHAWQKGSPYWYRAFDSDTEHSEWELSQIVGDFEILPAVARDQSLEVLLGRQIQVARSVAAKFGLSVVEIAGLEWAAPDARFVELPDGTQQASILEPSAEPPGDTAHRPTRSCTVPPPGRSDRDTAADTRAAIARHLGVLAAQERAALVEQMDHWRDQAKRFGYDRYRRDLIDSLQRRLDEPTPSERVLAKMTATT